MEDTGNLFVGCKYIHSKYYTGTIYFHIKNRNQNRPGGQRQFPGTQYRGATGRYDQRGMAGGQHAKNRDPSVLAKPDWTVLEEIDLPRLQKLNLHVEKGVTVYA